MQILQDTLVAILNLDDIEVVAAVTDGDAIVPARWTSGPTSRWSTSTCPAPTG